ncbi:MAG: SDR family oxidoreductase [Gammaproteobacteria bacterium]|nr:SDR family oxidoreductase [Gammaproteobacteria bacterium]
MPTVLITGANRGLGLEFALQYSASGWQVHACCRNPSAATDLAELAGGARGKVVVHRLDPTDFAAVGRLADELSGTPIDVLVNNAGCYTLGGFAAARFEAAFGKSDFNDWEQVFRVNVFAPMAMAEAFFDNLASSEQRKLITISSIMGSIGLNAGGGSYAYRSSKAAVNAVMRSLSLDLAERGIQVALLHPGWVSTDMGGPDADITAEVSVTGMRKVIESLKPEDSGCFRDYRGKNLSW